MRRRRNNPILHNACVNKAMGSYGFADYKDMHHIYQLLFLTQPKFAFGSHVPHHPPVYIINAATKTEVCML